MALKLKIKTAAASGSTRPTLEALSTEATRYRELALEVDALSAEMKVLKASLLDGATGERDRLLEAGEAASSIKVPTDDGNRVLVVFSERYKALGDENIEVLKEAFGADYSLLAEETTKVTATAGTTLAEIEGIIGKAAAKKLATAGVLTETTTVAPRKGAPASIAKMYKTGDAEKAGDMTEFYTACVYAPSVRAK